jgi:hypothetical protein
LWYGIGAMVVVVVGTALCPLAFVPFSFILPLLTGSALVPDLAGIPTWLLSLAAVGLPSLCIVGLMTGLLVWIGSKVRRRFTSDMKNYHEKKAMFERDEKPRWQAAKARWEQLYYCMRDETIFIPEEMRAVRADDIQKYLYDPQFGI